MYRNWPIFNKTKDIKHQFFNTFSALSKTTEPQKLTKKCSPLKFSIGKGLENASLFLSNEVFRKRFPVSSKSIAWKIESYLRKLQTQSNKSILLFQHYQKSLNCENSQKSFPTTIQNWKILRKLFPVSFKCIVWKIDSYLRKLQTSSTKSIILSRIIKNH